MSDKIIVPNEAIVNKIYEIRGQKVMIDRDLAELYGTETRVLKQSVRRNIKRFPEDFMFEMTKEELENWRSQNVTSKEDKKGLRYAPFCFTEQGVTMLSCVLNSDRAIEMNIKIIRVFVQLKEMLLTHKDILLKMEEIEKKVMGQDDKIKLVYDYLKKFVQQQRKPRKQIGFKRNDE
jgi:hypothetical protein